METIIKKVYTTKDIIISLAILAVGIVLFFFNTIAGIFISALAIVILFINKSGYKKDGNSVILKKKIINLDQAFRDETLNFLKGKSNTITLKDEETGSQRLELYYNKKAIIAYAQLFNFSNYSYEKDTDIIELTQDRAKQVINQL